MMLIKTIWMTTMTMITYFVSKLNCVCRINVPSSQVPEVDSEFSSIQLVLF